MSTAQLIEGIEAQRDEALTIAEGLERKVRRLMIDLDASNQARGVLIEQRDQLTEQRDPDGRSAFITLKRAAWDALNAKLREDRRNVDAMDLAQANARELQRLRAIVAGGEQ